MESSGYAGTLRRSLMLPQVRGGGFEPFGAILETAESVITTDAQDTAHALGTTLPVSGRAAVVIVIEVPPLVSGRLGPTDGALLRKTLVPSEREPHAFKRQRQSSASDFSWITPILSDDGVLLCDSALLADFGKTLRAPILAIALSVTQEIHAAIYARRLCWTAFVRVASPIGV